MFNTKYTGTLSQTRSSFIPLASSAFTRLITLLPLFLQTNLVGNHMTRGATDLIQMQLSGLTSGDLPQTNIDAARRTRAERHGLPQRERALPQLTLATLDPNLSIVTEPQQPLPLSTLRSMTQQLIRSLNQNRGARLQ